MEKERFIDISFRFSEEELGDLFFNALEKRYAQIDGQKQLNDDLLDKMLSTDFDQKDYDYLHNHFKQTREIIKRDSSNRPTIKEINKLSNEQWEFLYQQLLFIKTTQILDNPNWGVLDYCSQTAQLATYSLSYFQSLFEKDENLLSEYEKGVLMGMKRCGSDPSSYDKVDLVNLQKQIFRSSILNWYKLKNLFQNRQNKSDELNYILVIVHSIFIQIYLHLPYNWTGKLFLTGRLASALELTKGGKYLDFEFGEVYHPNSSLAFYSDQLVRRVRYYLEKPFKDSFSEVLINDWFTEWRDVKDKLDQQLKDMGT